MSDMEWSDEKLKNWKGAEFKNEISVTLGTVEERCIYTVCANLFSEAELDLLKGIFHLHKS